MALSNTTDPQRAARSLAEWWQKANPEDADVAVSNVHMPHAAGMSSETILFDLTRTDAHGTEHLEKLAARVIVLGGEVFPDYDLRREALVMRAVRSSTRAPVPAVLSVEYDSAVLGGPFLVMEQLQGRTLSDDPPFTAGGWFTELPAEGRSAIFDNGLTALAEVHRTDISALGPEILGHPDRAGSATSQHIKYWEDFFNFSRNGKSHRVIEAALQWLTDNLPDDEAALGLVLGDARPGNMMFDDESRVTAVLDWELLALGPAEIDLGWFAPESEAIHMLFVCESEDAFEQYVDNPLLSFFAATAGRLDMTKWEREGIESVMPLDWHYAFKMLSGSYTREQVYAITDKVTPEMVRKTYHVGNPAEIAAKVRPFTDAGATRHAFADVSALLGIKDPADAVNGMIEVSRLVKAD